MFIPRLRHGAAQLITKGQLDRDAHQIQRALETERGQADRSAIDAIVAHATASVPYYQPFRGVPLEQLPVVDKVRMRPHLDSFLIEGVDRSTLKTRSTSGSTGIPFTVYMDPLREARNHAGAVASIRYAGGDPFAPSVRTRAWATLSTKDRLINALKGHYAHNGDHFDGAPVMDIARWVSRRRNVVLQGYSSYLERIFRVWEEAGTRFEPGIVGAVISGAEAPTPYLSDAAKRLFGVSAFSRYSNMELGVMSTSEPESLMDYRFDISTFHLEILREDSDQPADPGKSGRIVVTDLHNLAMPLLRYDTGDLGRFALTADGLSVQNVLTHVEGRRLDVLVAGTPARPHRAHPLAVWGPVAQVESIHQFQLRQHDIGHFTWTLNATRSLELESFLRATLDERVGNIISCEFSYVEGVPVMQSGKRQFFVNEMPNPLSLLGLTD